jgi:sodium-dependent dicarboxylate transporter 2/3/5
VRPPLRLILLGLGLAGASGVALAAGPSAGWPREASLMAGIFVLAAFLWATEALPLFVTALLVIALEIVLLANPGQWNGLGFATGPSPDYREIIRSAADPVLLLFFGGMLLARSAVNEGVDRAMSAFLLRPFGHGPLRIALGIMIVTATFSMWMSNTATTAMMLALVMPLLAQVPPGDPYRKLLVLAVPFGANIGGIGTPIASPPNAVALGFLQQAGQTLSFVDWMLAAIPLMAALLLIAWGLLCLFYRPRHTGLTLAASAEPLTPRRCFVIGVFALTVLLWMTDSWHGLPAAVVALFPVLAFTATGVLGRADVNSIEWNILILIGGGIGLGAGMQLTGLDRILLGYLPAPDAGEAALIGTLIAATVLFSTFMSNTATANLVLPIGISSAAAFGEHAPVQIAFSVAVAASLTMALPISTPPNAMAYATGEIATRDMARVGLAISVLGGGVVMLLVPALLRLWGILP